MSHTVSRDICEDENRVWRNIRWCGLLWKTNEWAKIVVGTSEERFHAVSRETCEGERKEKLV